MEAFTELQDYVHPRLGEEIAAIGGHYEFTKESRFSYNDREILYFVGYAVLNSSCCGAGGCSYALVPGYICSWKYKHSSDGLSVSQIEPIRNVIVQREIERAIKTNEMIQQVTFR